MFVFSFPKHHTKINISNQIVFLHLRSNGNSIFLWYSIIFLHAIEWEIIRKRNTLLLIQWYIHTYIHYVDTWNFHNMFQCLYGGGFSISFVEISTNVLLSHIIANQFIIFFIHPFYKCTRVSSQPVVLLSICGFLSQKISCKWIIDI